MTNTRQQILELIKQHGSVTVQELSEALGLTGVTIRHHLEILQAEGYVASPEVQRDNRPGRPRYTYSLSARSIDLFPNNYCGLAQALLSSVQEQLAGEVQDEIVERVAARMAADVDPRRPSTPRERVEQAVTVMNQHGHTAKWEEDPEHAGRFLVYMNSCPYHKLAQTYEAPCKIDLRLMELLLPGAKVERPVTEAHRGGICTYTVAMPESADA